MIDLDALFGLDQLAKPEVIPIDRTIVLWDCEPETFVVTKLKVMNARDQTERTSHEYPNSAGCCEAAWLTNLVSTPIGIFLRLLADGFRTRQDMLGALHQFRNVEGQEDWTTAMLLRMDDPDILSLLEQDAPEEDPSTSWTL